MTIRVACQCGKQYQVADEHAGKQTTCKACGATLRILEAPPKVGTPRQTVPLFQTAPQRATTAPAQAAPPRASRQADAQPTARPPSAKVIREPYHPLLTPTGKKKTMGNLAMRGELKKMPGVELISSDVYNVGQQRSLMERLKAGTMLGPVKLSEIRVDSLQLFHFRDVAGEFAVIVPFDNGIIAPIEFVARLPGRLPAALMLLKQSGGKVALEAGVVLGGPIGTLLQHVGPRVESIWVGCDGSVPPVAQAAMAAAHLSQGVRWEGKIGGGPVSTIYRLSWGVQAVPLDDASFLLVAQTVPKQKMFGLEFGASWFHNYRRQFTQFVAELPGGGTGEFAIHDPGVWLSSAIEVLRWVD